MGVIEDVMQDFLGPLHAIREKLQTVETEQRDLREELLRMFKKAEQDDKTHFQELVTTLNLDSQMKRVEQIDAENEEIALEMTKNVIRMYANALRFIDHATKSTKPSTDAKKESESHKSAEK